MHKKQSSGSRLTMSAKPFFEAMHKDISDLSFRPFISIIGGVATVHIVILLAWSSSQPAQIIMQSDMSVSLNVATQSAQPSTPQQQKAAVTPVPVPEQVSELLIPKEIEQTVAEVPSSTTATTSANSVSDSEPDYKAVYLNNPPPSYPMAARRNGLQGRVVLNVEVLANGASGQVTVQKSSGYTMLDNAAVQTVKTWRFVPARHGGQAVDKWFVIPIQFSLKGG